MTPRKFELLGLLHLMSRLFVLGTLAFCFTIHAQAASSYTTEYRYNIGHQQTGVIYPDPDGTGPLNLKAVRNTYGPGGVLLKVEKGELLSLQPEDIDPVYWSGFTIFHEVDYT